MQIIEVYEAENVDLIEKYGKPTVTIAGRTYSSACLVEDGDGIRILIVPDLREVKSNTWMRAHAAGARLLVSHAGDNLWMAVTVEQFLSRRTEHHASGCYRLAVEDVTPIVGDPSYRAFVEFRRMEDERNKPRSSGFVHLHAHSEYSALDGLSKVTEMVAQAVADNQPALSVDDHGTCAGHPVLQAECEKAGIKPIFGIEGYFVGDRFFRPMSKPVVKDLSAAERDAVLAQYDADQKKAKDYSHLILWAENDTGLRNLWAMTTEANRDGFYYHPRMDWDTLERHAEGVMASTACLRGPLAPYLLNDDEDMARLVLARFRHIFRDRLYVELHTNQLPEQKLLNTRLALLAHDLSLPTVAVVDSHYPCADDQQTHKVWLAVQTNKDVQDEGDLFAGHEEYHLMAEDEVRKSLAYLGDSVVDQALAGTIAVADRCSAGVRKVAANTPTFSKTARGQADDVDRLVELCLSNWNRKLGWRIERDNNFAEYADRFEYEMKLLIDKGFCGYFLMVADYVQWAKDNHILVGPGRGSGGGCLVAYLCGITEIEPVEAGLLFERFLSPGRTELPDFDVDFPTSKIPSLIAYVHERWGAEHVVRVGTHLRLKNKGVIRKLATVLGTTETNIHWPDIDSISKIITRAEVSTAGKGLPWDELMELHADELEPFVAKYPALFEWAEKLVGRLSSYGRHAAGFVISPDQDLTNAFPMRVGEDGQSITEFDMDVLAMLGLVKFDLLALRNLDTIQMTVDFIFERTGKWVDVYSWVDEYKDERVWDELSSGRTLGCFQIETSEMTKIVKRLKPRSLADLADAITIVRPGPKRSGLTEEFFQRREGTREIDVPDPRLEPVLRKTLGCILYQEDIMQTCMVLAGYDGAQADTVRSILGKKKVEKVKEEGAKFIPACVERGMPEDKAIALWEQMEEFAKYSFNRAHAFGYAVIAYWCAWLKFNYPLEFLTALLSTVDKERIPEFVVEARRMGMKVLPPDINISGRGFAPFGDDVIRYGLDSVKGVGEAKLDAITVGQPYTSWDDFRERCNADSGVVRLLAHVGAFDSIYPNRNALDVILEREVSGDAARCVHKDDSTVGPNGLPCTFDWSSIPVKVGKSGKPLKTQPGPPKKCTKACRSYTAPPPLDPTTVEKYTDEQIRAIEMENLGVYLSSTPFDSIPAELWDRLSTFEEVDAGESGQVFVIVGIVRAVRPRRDRNGKDMAFITLMLPTGSLDLACFSSKWSEMRDVLVPDRLVLAKVRKNDRGINLDLVISV